MNDNTMSIPHLIMSASIVVQLVMLLLVVGSILSWVVIFQRSIALRRAKQEYNQFEESFWSGVDLNELYREIPADAPRHGAEHIFQAGFREFNRLMPKTRSADTVLEGVQRSMRVAWSREEDPLTQHLVFLATVASASPYIGFFGTVWGIMNSFRSLSTLQHVTVATVAPGISEALIATAMGLFAAIPAVIAYNRFSSNAESLIARYEVFVEEFLSIVNRQALGINRRA